MYYFAYGSNMNWPQMQRRCPSAQFVCVARLLDYRFAIARHSRLRKCGTANVIPEKGSEVWGIAYAASDEDLLSMDSFEDGYRREQVLVYPANDGDLPLQCLVYIAPKEDAPPPPNIEYRRLLLEGALHWCLPNHYCAMLQKIEVVDS